MYLRQLSMQTHGYKSYCQPLYSNFKFLQEKEEEEKEEEEEEQEEEGRRRRREGGKGVGEKGRRREEGGGGEGGRGGKLEKSQVLLLGTIVKPVCCTPGYHDWGSRGGRTHCQGKLDIGKMPSPAPRCLCMWTSVVRPSILTLFLVILAQCHPSKPPTHGESSQAVYVCGLALGRNNYRLFCSLGGGNQTKSHCLANVGGSYHTHSPLIVPNLPSQHAISFTYLLGILSESLLGNPQCNTEGYLFLWISIPPMISSIFALLNSAQWLQDWDRALLLLRLPSSLFPLPRLSPTPCLQHCFGTSQYNPEHPT